MGHRTYVIVGAISVHRHLSQHSCRRVSFSCLFRFLIQVGVGDGSAVGTVCWSSATLQQPT
jgi:hypothetical protein